MTPSKVAFAATAIVVVGGVLLLGPLLQQLPNHGSPPDTPSPTVSPTELVATSPPTLPPVTGLPGTFAFRRDDGVTIDAYLMRPDRSGLVRLTSDVKRDSAPILSPDGSRVVFERLDPVAANAEIWVVDSDGTNELPITLTSEFEDWPSWSADGTRVMFVRSTISGGTIVRSEIAIRDVGRDARFLAPSEDQIVIRRDADPGNWAPGFVPTWSPDGSLVAFTSDMDGTEQLYTIRVDGSGLTKLTTMGASGRPAWSPDSSTIAFREDRIDGCIWLVDAVGSEPRSISTGDCTDGPLAWSPDGTMIAWAGGGETAAIRVVDIDGTNPRQLTGDDLYGDLSWSAAEP